MVDAHVPGTPFDFETVILHNPISASQKGGGYFSQILKKDSRPLLVQTVASKSKAGLTKGARVGHLDVIVDPDGLLCEWLADLEAALVDQIARNASVWFTSAMDRDEVDYLLIPTCKTYRKQTAMRTLVPVPRYTDQVNSVMFFDENERPVPRETLTPESEFIAVIEVSGVRFTTSSMRIELTVRQVMILGEQTPTTCLIKKVAREDKPVVETKPTGGVQSNRNEQEESTAVLDSTSETSVKELTLVEPISSEQNEPINADEQNTVPREGSSDNQDGLGVVVESNNDKPEDLIDSAEDGSPEANSSLELESSGSNLEEIQLRAPSDAPVIGLKEKDEVYQALYEEVYQKARETKKQAIRLYLEAQELQSEHALTAIESSDDEDEGEHLLH